LCAHRRFQICGKHTRLNYCNRIAKTDFLDPIHPDERQGNPATSGNASAYITKSGATCCDRNFLPRGKLEQLADVICGSCKDDNFRLVCREPLVDAVRGKSVRIVCDNFVAEEFAKL